MKLLVDGMLADIARLGVAGTDELRDLREGWSAMLKGASGAEVVALCKVLRGRLPEDQRWLAEELMRYHPEASGTLPFPSPIGRSKRARREAVGG